MRAVALFLAVVAALAFSQAFSLHVRGPRAAIRAVQHSIRVPSTRLFDADKPIENIEEVTKKYGLEAGLFKAATTKDATDLKPADLIKKYGAAYLLTSITLAAISYAICYFAISLGVDVSSLLSKIGIKASETANNVGTAGLAYAVHKAASPIRFPPTVALTPVVAGWLGRKDEGDSPPAGAN